MTAYLSCDNDFGTAGTGDDSAFATSDYIKVVEVAAMSLDGPGPGYLRLISLEESLGAVFGMIWCEYYGVYSWSMLYWPALEFSGKPSQVSAVRAGGIWSGFMSEARGLTWDRKSRYGKK